MSTATSWQKNKISNSFLTSNMIYHYTYDINYHLEYCQGEFVWNNYRHRAVVIITVCHRYNRVPRYCFFEVDVQIHVQGQRDVSHARCTFHENILRREISLSTYSVVAIGQHLWFSLTSSVDLGTSNSTLAGSRNCPLSREATPWERIEGISSESYGSRFVTTKIITRWLSIIEQRVNTGTYRK